MAVVWYTMTRYRYTVLEAMQSWEILTSMLFMNVTHILLAFYHANILMHTEKLTKVLGTMSKYLSYLM